VTGEVMAADQATDPRAPIGGIADRLALTRAQKGEIRELTEQFYLTLRASFSRVGAERNLAAAKKIERLFDDPEHSWSAAYEIEQLLILLYDDETVRAELDVRLLEATRVLRKELAAHYVAQANETATKTNRDSPPGTSLKPENPPEPIAASHSLP
jgi:hypothetical protein